MDFKKEIKHGRDLLYYVNDKLRADSTFLALDSEERFKQVSELDEHKQFILAFPIVSRYIIQLGMFSSKVFEKYLTHMNTIKPTPEERSKCMNNEEEQMLWLNKQRALYVKWLHMNKSNNQNTSEANDIYNQTVELLDSDTKKIFALINSEKQKMKVKDNKTANEIRENIIKNISEKLAQSDLLE
jgi:phosphatidylserine/phosphatidylglycerophosphate/cardiolipin synthase-like enzyme